MKYVGPLFDAGQVPEADTTPILLDTDISATVSPWPIDATTDIDVTGTLPGQQLTVDEAGTALAFGLASKYLPVRKGSVGTITAGTPVYIFDYNPSGYVEVEIADASSGSTLMPAIGIAFESITNGGQSRVLMSGLMSGLDTSLYAVRDRLYVDTVAGTGLPWLTPVKPTTGHLQAIATVVRSHASQGSIVVHGASRENDVPHLSAADRYWFGSSGGTVTEGTITAAGRAILDDATAAAQRATLGILTQQGARSGQTIYVQLTADSDPGAPVAGDIRIREP